ncbi:MAG: hypothetical protein ABI863_12855 [Ginsengibacter sp.]
MTYIADADNKKVKGLYMLIEDEISNGEKFKLTGDHITILEEERKKHANGKSKSYSWDEFKQIIRGNRKL